MTDSPAPLDLPPDAAVATASRFVSQALLAAHAAGRDVAEFVAYAAACAAATLDGVEVLLGNRSGSWEASALRDLLLGTVGHGEEYLDDHRHEELDRWLARRQEDG